MLLYTRYNDRNITVFLTDAHTRDRTQSMSPPLCLAHTGHTWRPDGWWWGENAFSPFLDFSVATCLRGLNEITVIQLDQREEEIQTLFTSSPVSVSTSLSPLSSPFSSLDFLIFHLCTLEKDEKRKPGRNQQLYVKPIGSQKVYITLTWLNYIYLLAVKSKMGHTGLLAPYQNMANHPQCSPQPDFNFLYFFFVFVVWSHLTFATVARPSQPTE